jgi:Leucine-rich repeat (LRR) protein
MEIALERIANMRDDIVNLKHLGLTELPPLPSTLVELCCSNNRLTELPPLPPALEVLNCYGNQLTSLPPLPPTLRRLICNINELTSLPPLPPTLRELYYSYNPIIYPPPDVIDKPLQYIRKWMDENPPTYTKSANKV